MLPIGLISTFKFIHQRLQAVNLKYPTPKKEMRTSPRLTGGNMSRTLRNKPADKPTIGP